MVTKMTLNGVIPSITSKWHTIAGRISSSSVHADKEQVTELTSLLAQSSNGLNDSQGRTRRRLIGCILRLNSKMDYNERKSMCTVVCANLNISDLSDLSIELTMLLGGHQTNHLG